MLQSIAMPDISGAATIKSDRFSVCCASLQASSKQDFVVHGVTKQSKRCFAVVADGHGSSPNPTLFYIRSKNWSKVLERDDWPDQLRRELHDMADLTVGSGTTLAAVVADAAGVHVYTCGDSVVKVFDTSDGDTVELFSSDTDDYRGIKKLSAEVGLEHVRKRYPRLVSMRVVDGLVPLQSTPHLVIGRTKTAYFQYNTGHEWAVADALGHGLATEQQIRHSFVPCRRGDGRSRRLVAVAASDGVWDVVAGDRADAQLLSTSTPDEIVEECRRRWCEAKWEVGPGEGFNSFGQADDIAVAQLCFE